MEQSQIEFIYNGVNTIIHCKADEKLKDIFKLFKNKVNANDKILIYLYDGIKIQNEELTFNEVANQIDKERNKMNILVNEVIYYPVPHTQDLIIKSKNIICPECKQDIKFKIEDYVINLFECKNKHDICSIFLNEFNSTQNINESKIICQNCGKYNKANVYKSIFYKCNSCKKDLCPICSSQHDKNHTVINYDDKNYICEQHNKSYIGYCTVCKQNICTFCEQDHNKHKIVTYGKKIPKDDEIKTILKQLEETMGKLQKDIDGIIQKLNDIKKNFEIYYNINKNIINNYNKEKINYEILYNIDNIKNINNTDIIKNINDIIKDNNIQNKFNKLINIYNKIESHKAITIFYTNNKNNDDIRIFGKEFVKNNINNCTMIIDNKSYKISEKFKIDNYNKDKIEVKLKGINKIINMSYMFSNCSSLLSLQDISKWNTSNVNDMSYMFSNCSSISSLPDISKWITSNVNNMSYMFNHCSSLSSLPDISKWNTSNVNNMDSMFNSCFALKSLPDLSKWNTSNVKNMSQMFYYCSLLKSLPDLSKWNTSNTKNMSKIFHNCSSLLSLPDISKWNTSNINNMESMFWCCKLLSSLPDISKWNTSNVNNMESMFSNCSSLLSMPDISKWNTSNVKNMNYMFNNCSSLLSLPEISKWNTSHLENNQNMYDGCSKLVNKPKIKKKSIFGKLFGNK